MPYIPGLRWDPFPNYRFYIALIDISSVLGGVVSAVHAAANVLLGGFSECTGLEMTMEIHEYKEGGVNEFVHKFATRTNYSNITLKRGVSFNDELWGWYHKYLQGRGTRRHGIITLMNEMGIPVKGWFFKKGIPLRWSGPQLNANQSAVAVESLEIAHQGLELFSPHAMGLWFT